MILVIDLGNSTVSCAVFDQSSNIVDRFRFSSKRDIFMTLDWQESCQKRLSLYTFSYAVFSSVVPSLSDSLNFFFKKITPTIYSINRDCYPLLPVDLINPTEIGTDLIANAVYAWDKTQAPCVVVDFGTALSFTIVNTQGMLSGVAIAPGLGLALNSLIENTEQLEMTTLKIPQTVSGIDTMTAIQAGTVLGYKYLVKGLISQIQKEVSPTVQVFLTGGFSTLFASEFKDFTYEHNLDLTLQGIYQIGQILHKQSL
ncbi:MAG: type III pantothenate kinase [Spirochaetia bacterium]